MLFHDLETDRLLLRCISADDREFILQQFSTDAVNRYLYDAEPMRALDEADDLIAFYTQPEPRAQQRWILVQKSDGAKIGTCGFHCWDTENSVADVGYDLQPAYWGRGLMAEAMTAMLAFGDQNMRVRELRAHIADENERSLRLAQRLGFVFCGETESCPFHGREYPHQILVRTHSRDIAQNAR